MIIDCHIHLYGERERMTDTVDYLLRHADRMGIEKLIVCLGPELVMQPSANRIALDTEYVMDAIDYAPDRIEGLVYGSPLHPDRTLELMDQYIVNGPMRGVKLWVCEPCSTPPNDIIAEYAGELGVPILQHTYFKSTGLHEGESTPADLAELANRNPQTEFLMAHSGGNWERGIRTVKNCPNISVDVCGGAPYVGQTEYAVEYLGPKRVLYGSDAAGRSFASQLAKVIGADITGEQRQMILADNAIRLFGLDV